VSAADADFNHLDYHPLLNKRAHRLSEGTALPPILNIQLKATYEGLIRALARRVGKLDSTDRLRLSYYLLCQDRVQEAQQQFELAGGSEGELAGLELQRDYMAAYFDLFGADGARACKIARKVASARASCPHLEWRKRFTELSQILSEIDAAEAPGTGAAAPTATLTAPSLSAELQGSGILELQATGLQTVNVKLYSVDLEMLFSRTPF